MRLLVLPIILALAMLASVPARAIEAGELLADPKLEVRARAISAELRCLVCQNESIDESHAPLARDLRLLVREQLSAGATDAQVFAYVTERYGDFVLLRPRFTTQTLLLWFGPFALLAAIGAILLMRYRSNRTSPAAPAPLSPQEADRVRVLLQRDSD
jgi:cytochrome c-type biogenesis protein CcmH